MNEDIIPENLDSIKNPQPPVNRPAPKVKPLVEGINAPAISRSSVIVKPALTEKEKKLLTETEKLESKPQLEASLSKIMPVRVVERAAKKKQMKTWPLVVALLFLIAGAAVWQWYSPFLPAQLDIFAKFKKSQTSPVLKNSNVEPLVQNNQNAAASSTPVVVPAASSTPATTTSPSITTPAKVLTISSTPTGYLNVRSQPSTSAKILSKVYPTESYTYTDSKTGWYKITLTDGQSGWVAAQYVVVK